MFFSLGSQEFHLANNKNRWSAALIVFFNIRKDYRT